MAFVADASASASDSAGAPGARVVHFSITRFSDPGFTARFTNGPPTILTNARKCRSRCDLLRDGGNLTYVTSEWCARKAATWRCRTSCSFSRASRVSRATSDITLTLSASDHPRCFMTSRTCAVSSDRVYAKWHFATRAAASEHSATAASMARMHRGTHARCAATAHARSSRTPARMTMRRSIGNPSPRRPLLWVPFGRMSRNSSGRNRAARRAMLLNSSDAAAHSASGSRSFASPRLTRRRVRNHASWFKNAPRVLVMRDFSNASSATSAAPEPPETRRLRRLNSGSSPSARFLFPPPPPSKSLLSLSESLPTAGSYPSSLSPPAPIESLSEPPSSRRCARTAATAAARPPKIAVPRCAQDEPPDPQYHRAATASSSSSTPAHAGCAHAEHDSHRNSAAALFRLGTAGSPGSFGATGSCEPPSISLSKQRKHGVTNGSGSESRSATPGSFLPFFSTFDGRTVRRSRLPLPKSSRSALTSRDARSASKDSSCLWAMSSGSAGPFAAAASSRASASASSSSARWIWPSPTPPRYPSPSSPSTSSGRLSRSSRRAISESLNSHRAFTFFSRFSRLRADSSSPAAARVTILRAPCISTFASSAARDTDPSLLRAGVVVVVLVVEASIAPSPFSSFPRSFAPSSASFPRFTTRRSIARLLLASSTMRSSTVAAVTS